MRIRLLPVVLLLSVAFAGVKPAAASNLLNVSYDVSRELYKEVNVHFAQLHQQNTGKPLRINQSHGGSSKQVMALSNGLAGDVATMNQAADLERLQKYGLVADNWRELFPYDAAPYTSTTVLLVRKGNPKNIQDWDDLAREGVKVVFPNPKVSGSGRYAYLAAWGYALHNTGSVTEANEFIAQVLANVPILDAGGRGSTTTFTQRGIGDVLVSFENESLLIASELGADKFEVIYPSISVDAQAPVAVLNRPASTPEKQALANAYLNFLFSAPGQELIAKHHFRPRDPEILAKHRNKFPPIPMFTVEKELGGWAQVQAQHFERGALFDQIMEQRHGRN